MATNRLPYQGVYYCDELVDPPCFRVFNNVHVAGLGKTAADVVFQVHTERMFPRYAPEGRMPETLMVSADRGQSSRFPSWENTSYFRMT